MMATLPPIPPRYVLGLIGGGHTHALLLLRLGRRPIANAKVYLISDVEQAPYSGMLPGHVGGVYKREEIHISLPKLCRFAGAEFILSQVGAVNLEKRHILDQRGNQLGLKPDVISINTGGTPNFNEVPGAAEFSIPCKPVPKLLEGWDRVQEAARKATAPLRVLVTGGGAGGVELTLAMHSQLPRNTEFTLVHASSSLLTGQNMHAQCVMLELLQSRGIRMILGQEVREVRATSVSLQSGDQFPVDFVFWVTQVAPPSWLRSSSLPLSEAGFIRVKPTLQAVQHPWIFAAGDVASIDQHPVPKSGVYAVRMASPLENNLRAWFEGRPLREYHPQRRSLSILGTADGRALATRGAWALRSQVMWWWKTWIDRRFMQRFHSACAFRV